MFYRSAFLIYDCINKNLSELIDKLENEFESYGLTVENNKMYFFFNNDDEFSDDEYHTRLQI